LLGVSEEQIRALERDGKVSPSITLFAPDSGIVWELGVRDGAAVSPGMSLFKLADLRTVWVNAEVPEMQADLVKPGAAVEARVTAVAGKVFSGKVAALLPDVNATTRTIKARIVLANPKGELAPGMFATLNFVSRQAAAVVVPTEAVISTGERNVVILADADGRFSPRPVTLGRASGDMTEILAGLAAGQKVVVSGQFLIDSEASLRGALNRMNEPDAPARAVPQKQTAKAHRGEGKIVAFAGDRITIQHAAIPSAGMGAMTMSFKAPGRIIPRHLEIGDRVSFEFVLSESGAELTWLAPIANEAPSSNGSPK
jgi:membrane fusion protein, copper/silver efflux system